MSSWKCEHEILTMRCLANPQATRAIWSSGRSLVFGGLVPSFATRHCKRESRAEFNHCHAVQICTAAYGFDERRGAFRDHGSCRAANRFGLEAAFTDTHG